MNLVYGVVGDASLVTQWLEHSTGVWKVIGSNPDGDLDSFLCPTLVA